MMTLNGSLDAEADQIEPELRCLWPLNFTGAGISNNWCNTSVLLFLSGVHLNDSEYV